MLPNMFAGILYSPKRTLNEKCGGAESKKKSPGFRRDLSVATSYS